LHPLKIIDNNQAVLVEDGVVKVVGLGKEILLFEKNTTKSMRNYNKNFSTVFGL